MTQEADYNNQLSTEVITIVKFYLLQIDIAQWLPAALPTKDDTIVTCYYEANITSFLLSTEDYTMPTRYEDSSIY